MVLVAVHTYSLGRSLEEVSTEPGVEGWAGDGMWRVQCGPGRVRTGSGTKAGP